LYEARLSATSEAFGTSQETRPAPQPVVATGSRHRHETTKQADLLVVSDSSHPRLQFWARGRECWGCLGGQVESLWDEVLPVGVRELPADLAALDMVLRDPGLFAPIVA
jgi:hypothetical protein